MQATFSMPNISKNHLRGMMLMFLAMQIVPITDAIAKILTADYGFSPGQTAWARIMISAIFLLPFGYARLKIGRDLPPSKLPLLRGIGCFFAILRPHWWRGLFWVGATFFYFAAIRDNPLPNALALLFIAPLFVAAAAPLLLGERFSLSRLVAVIAAFGGVLIVLRPSADSFSPSLALALAAGLCYGGYLMATRRARQNTDGVHTALTAMLTAAILASPLLIADWKTPSLSAAGLMFAMGGLSALGHYFIAKSCEYADASQLAPFIYSEMIGALLLSYMLFGETPDAVATIGIAIIMAAGLSVMMQDTKG